MEWLPRAEVRLEDGAAPVVIIDTSLALSPFGLLTTLRLAAADAEVWLTPSLWRHLDEASLERWRPLPKAPHDGEADAARCAVVAQWERARLDLGGKRLCWIAETADESSLPKGLGAGVVARFDRLKASLAEAAGSDEAGIDDGCLDSLILAAALAERPAAIFAIEEDEGLGLVEAANSLGAVTKRLPATAARQLLQRWWHPLFLRAGLLEFFASGGQKLASLRLIAPGALYVDAEPEDEAANGDGNWLGGAHLMWSAM